MSGMMRIRLIRSYPLKTRGAHKAIYERIIAHI